MKHDETSYVLKKIEEALDKMKKRMYEIKKENNPNLDWNSFCKKFDSMNDSSDISLKNKLFQEEIDKIIQVELNSENKRLLVTVKDAIDFETIEIRKENKISSFILKTAVLLAHFLVFYITSVIVFGIFSSFLCVPVWYIFLLSLITSTLFMLCDMPSKNIKAFIFDPFLSYKLLVLYMLIMMFINITFYQVFESSILWMLFIALVAFINKILSRNIHKLWWRY